MTPWFLEQMKELVVLEEEIRKYKGKSLPDELLIQAKKDGFGDKYLSMLIDQPESEIRKQRIGLGVTEAWEPVTVSGIKEAAYYYYSTYNAPDKTVSSGNPKVMILGGGPNRIGQGIEFDYCCVHAAFTLRDLGYETIMVNCNPETVSTDYDTSDKLYFEPLTVEDVLSIYEKEKPIGVIAQFGGQTPLNIAGELEKAGVKILGTALETIDLAEDRDRFKAAMDKLGIPMPEAGMASSLDEAIKVAGKIGYPVMVRPSYVLGGRGMEIVHDEKMLAKYVGAAMNVNPGKPILIDRFLENAIEAEADAISDGTDVFVPAVMEHIEYAGIHSGDSACVVPPVSIPEKHVETIKKYTKLIAQELNVKGLMNIQYAIADDRVYVIEANPRASRTVPIVSKVCNISMARIATEVIMADQKGDKIDIANMSTGDVPYYGVKESSVFPFNMFHEVDPVLGPEMRSTGEVLGLSESSGIAFFKAQEATKNPLTTSGTVLITVRDEDKKEVLAVARKLADLGFAIKATEGTQKFLTDNGIQSTEIPKLGKGRPDIVDSITNKEINMVINTPVGEGSKEDDSYIRKAAIRGRVPYITTIAAAVATAKGIEAYLKADAAETKVKKLQEFHAQLKK
jgi:carbamoyl-phosphate synthase large subunit